MSSSVLSRFVFGLGLLTMALLPCACETVADLPDGGGLEGYYDASDSKSGSGANGGRQDGFSSGVVTAGEWNDLDHWAFWCDLLTTQNDSTRYYTYPSYWHYNTSGRVGLKLLGSDGLPLVDVPVRLQKGDALVWSSRSDNLGRAELFLGLNDQEPAAPDVAACSLYVGDVPVTAVLQKDTLNEITLTWQTPASDRVELAFVVDATGSMADEMDFLKKDLEDVVTRVQSANSRLDIYTAAVFYRDEGDSYVVKHQDFTPDLDKTVRYIRAQSAAGGGDYPEAVHTALKETWSQLQWSSSARTRIAFLVLDAPPHYDDNVIADLHRSVRRMADKGIKVIPVSASGVDKPTEFLLRYLAIATNGTYVFLTDDSGVGLPHLSPSVGYYQVEKLNDLLVRLIGKYSD